MPETVSKAEFAKRIKTKYPQYASIPDDKLVQSILAKYPDYGKVLAQDATPAPKQEPAKAAPTTPAGPQKSETSKILDRMGQNFDAMADMPGQFLTESRARFKEARDKGDVKGMMMAVPRDVTDLVGKLAQSYYNVSAFGLPGRLARKEPPSNLVGDAAAFYMPGGEEGSITETAGKRFTAPVDATKPGSLIGSHTRAVEAYKRLSSAYGDVPIDHSEAYAIAQKAKLLEKKGFSIPPPINKFIEWIESRSKGAPTSIPGQPNAAIDTPGSPMMPLDYRASQDFKTAINEAVPWDDFGKKGGKMHRLSKDMAKALDRATVEAFKPYGVDTVFKRANAEYAKAMRWRERALGIGYVSGKLAGYSAGLAGIGHPLPLGYAGAKIGEPLAGSLVRSVVESGSKE
jgi:hypothetical protein